MGHIELLRAQLTRSSKRVTYDDARRADGRERQTKNVSSQQNIGNSVRSTPAKGRTLHSVYRTSHNSQPVTTKVTNSHTRAFPLRSMAHHGEPAPFHPPPPPPFQPARSIAFTAGATVRPPKRTTYSELPIGCAPCRLATGALRADDVAVVA